MGQRYQLFEIASKPFTKPINRDSMEENGDRKLTRQSSAQISSQARSLKSKSIKLKSRRIIEEQQAHQTRAVLAKDFSVH